MGRVSLDVSFPDAARSRAESIPESGHLIVADSGAPDGDDGAARPTEMLLAALASCTAMDVAAILRKKRQVPAGYALHVEADAADEPPRVFTRIVVEHRLSGNIDAEAVRRSVELSATRYCPVSRMLSRAVEIEHRYRLDPPGRRPEGALVVVTGPGSSG
jgi:putative redox protein